MMTRVRVKVRRQVRIRAKVRVRKLASLPNGRQAYPDPTNGFLCSYAMLYALCAMPFLN